LIGQLKNGFEKKVLAKYLIFSTGNKTDHHACTKEKHQIKTKNI